MTWFYAYLAIGVIYGAISLLSISNAKDQLETGYKKNRAKLDPDKELPDSAIKVIEDASIFLSVFVSGLFWIVVLPVHLFLALKNDSPNR